MCRQIALIATVLLLAGGANAQSSAARSDALLSGLREYPISVRAALLAVAHEPELLKRIADGLSRDGKFEVPENIGDGLKSAYQTLGANPELILFAADQSQTLSQVAQIYDRDPQQVERRWDEMARGYDRARRDAARVWQKMLEADPMVLRDYIAALHQFSTQRREQNAGFALIQVQDRGYYYAAPPNDALLAQLDSQQISAGLKTVIERWWHRYGDGAMDAEALRSGPTPMRDSQSDAVVDWSPAERRGMWHPAGQAGGKAIGLMPVMLQPLEDQPNEARVAYAIAENMRLWGPQAAEPDPSSPAAEEYADSAPAAAIQDQDVAALPADAYADGADIYSNSFNDIPYSTYSNYSEAPIYGGVPSYVSVPSYYSGDVFGAYPYGYYSYGVPSFSVFATFGYGGFCGRPRCFTSSASYYDYGAYPQHCRDPYGIWGPAFGTRWHDNDRHVYTGIRGPVRVTTSGAHFDRVQPRSVISLDGNRGDRIRHPSVGTRETVSVIRTPSSSPPVRSIKPAVTRPPLNPTPRSDWPTVDRQSNRPSTIRPAQPAPQNVKPTSIRPTQPAPLNVKPTTVRPVQVAPQNPRPSIRPAQASPPRNVQPARSPSVQRSSPMPQSRGDNHSKPVKSRP